MGVQRLAQLVAAALGRRSRPGSSGRRRTGRAAALATTISHDPVSAADRHVLLADALVDGDADQLRHGQVEEGVADDRQVAEQPSAGGSRGSRAGRAAGSSLRQRPVGDGLGQAGHGRHRGCRSRRDRLVQRVKRAGMALLAGVADAQSPSPRLAGSAAGARRGRRAGRTSARRVRCGSSCLTRVLTELEATPSSSAASWTRKPGLAAQQAQQIGLGVGHVERLMGGAGAIAQGAIDAPEGFG